MDCRETQDYGAANACSEIRPTEIRSHSGPIAKEAFILCRPDPAEKDIVGQTASVYRRLYAVLRQEGASAEHVMQEMVFFRNVQGDLNPFHKTRALVFPRYAPAATFIQQAPINQQHLMEILAYAFIPKTGATLTSPGLTVFHQPTQRTFFAGGCKHFFAANIYGLPGKPEEETYSMFQSAERLLRGEQMTFQNVVRTWIHLRHISRDYPGFNEGRTKFFRERELLFPPASTGIEGVPPSDVQNLCLSLCGIQSPMPIDVQPMFSPTLNEAWTYGADFSRGLKVVGTNAITLFVSGTASVDEKGRTVHAYDFEEQAERMILNISALLAQQNASFGDVVSAITYLKHPANASLLAKIFTKRKIENFPNALVHARVCRPDLLCEMEVIAVLPIC